MSGVTDDLVEFVVGYLNSVGSGSWTPQAVASVVASERRSQLQACKLPRTHTATVATTTGSAEIVATDDAFTSYDVGATVTGAGIPDGTTVIAVDSSTELFLSAGATADGTAVTITVDPDLSDLNEALARRVATNLANRNLPLGVQTQVAEFGSTMTRVGGYDREVTRLERPYRVTPAG